MQRRPEAAGDLLEEVRAHDATLRARNIELWIGAEPTFTLRQSQDPEWLVQAEGGRKLEKGIELLQALVAELGVPATFVRARGRHFPGELQPRFCLGAEWVRGSSGKPVNSVSALLDGPLEAVPEPHPERAWLTVTPDPGVVEVNLPPSPDLESFLDLSEAAYRAADTAGLSSERFRFNGEGTDSGGGGQITLGGPTPQASPFFVQPWLLPAVLRYLQRHPSLSYAFAGECVGSASQGPRPDEGVRERFEELAVSLDRLEARGRAVTPEELWGSLAPLLVDASGNAHRAEVNV
ncbi:MAG TPA: transglutaminase family protein [Myxococcaceae bacterium]